MLPQEMEHYFKMAAALHGRSQVVTRGERIAQLRRKRSRFQKMMRDEQSGNLVAPGAASVAWDVKPQNSSRSGGALEGHPRRRSPGN